MRTITEESSMPDYSFKGPPLSEGPLPAVFYFALTAEESLNQEPINQPVKVLEQKRMRIFSCTLPYHGDERQAIKIWAEEVEKGNNFFMPFIQKVQKTIQELIQERVVDPDHLGVMGLSRGAFIAAHLAAKEPKVKAVLGFAPLTTLATLCEESPLVHTLSLENIAHPLIGKKVRFYIGNRDERVKTAKAFAFIEHLAELNWHAGHRSPPVELIITPSLGYKGHGTTAETFEQGASWLNHNMIEN